MSCPSCWRHNCCCWTGVSPTAPPGKTSSAGGHSRFQSSASATVSVTTRARITITFLFLSLYVPQSPFSQYELELAMESEKGNIKTSNLLWDRRVMLRQQTEDQYQHFIIYHRSVQHVLKRILNSMSIFYDWIIIDSNILINFSWFIQIFIP